MELWMAGLKHVQVAYVLVLFPLVCVQQLIKLAIPLIAVNFI